MKRRNPRINYSTEVSLWYYSLSLDEMTKVLKIYHDVLNEYSEMHIYVDISEDREYETGKNEGTYTLRFFRVNTYINGVYDKDKMLGLTDNNLDDLNLLMERISDTLGI